MTDSHDMVMIGPVGAFVFSPLFMISLGIWCVVVIVNTFLEIAIAFECITPEAIALVSTFIKVLVFLSMFALVLNMGAWAYRMWDHRRIIPMHDLDAIRGELHP